MATWQTRQLVVVIHWQAQEFARLESRTLAALIEAL